MAEITQELLNEMFEYSDGNLIRKVNSRRAKAGSIAGWKDGRYMRVRVKGKMMLVHRIIFMMQHGYMPETIDHINGDSFDNRIENLREATQQQNCLNRRLRSDNKCGVSNVFWHKQHKKYAVNVTIDGKSTHLGYFQDLTDASEMAEMAKKKHYGEFTCTGERNGR